MEKYVIIIMCAIYLVSWLIVHLLCEYKYFWCKGNCSKCHNWRCIMFPDRAIKSVRCTSELLDEYLNKIGKRHLISMSSVYYEKESCVVYTLVFNTPGLYLSDYPSCIICTK